MFVVCLFIASLYIENEVFVTYAVVGQYAGAVFLVLQVTKL
jgi:hypothetical protein